jgi:hypothetical protein
MRDTVNNDVLVVGFNITQGTTEMIVTDTPMMVTRRGPVRSMIRPAKGIVAMIPNALELWNSPDPRAL